MEVTNNTYLTISLMIIVGCSLGVLYLFYQMRRGFVEVKQMIADHIRNTDYDFRALKTRMRDEEKDDQAAKRRAR
jgi:cell division protein FtsL